ncbi:MAG: methyltransferase type 12 [Caldithrix sp.]|nr:methyltransferase type 12 [Caldithrix sp.]
MTKNQFSTNGKSPSYRSPLTFIMEFLKHPMQVGSLIPSSRFIQQRILQAAEIAKAHTIVELGPGTGGTTRTILSKMRPDAKLLSIEVNPQFHNWISTIQDKRFIAHLGSANELRTILKQYDLQAPSVIVSGIPFSNIDEQTAAHLIAEIDELLAPNGRFVAYQVRNRVAELCTPVMGNGRRKTELRNFPPMRIYSWEKNGKS